MSYIDVVFKAKIVIIVALVVLTGCGHDDEALEADHYTSMVCAHEATGQGWPDYKNLKPDCDALRGIDESKTRYYP